VVFVRDLDRGAMGRGAHALEHYETLRACTDALVNAILRMRRLLKQKRASDTGTAADSPRPIVSHSFSASSLAASSLASDWPATPTHRPPTPDAAPDRAAAAAAPPPAPAAPEPVRGQAAPAPPEHPAAALAPDPRAAASAAIRRFVTQGAASAAVAAAPGPPAESAVAAAPGPPAEPAALAAGSTWGGARSPPGPTLAPAPAAGPAEAVARAGGDAPAAPRAAGPGQRERGRMPACPAPGAALGSAHSGALPALPGWSGRADRSVTARLGGRASSGSGSGLGSGPRVGLSRGGASSGSGSLPGSADPARAGGGAPQVANGRCGGAEPGGNGVSAFARAAAAGAAPSPPPPPPPVPPPPPASPFNAPQMQDGALGGAGERAASHAAAGPSRAAEPRPGAPPHAGGPARSPPRRGDAEAAASGHGRGEAGPGEARGGRRRSRPRRRRSRGARARAREAGDPGGSDSSGLDGGRPRPGAEPARARGGGAGGGAPAGEQRAGRPDARPDSTPRGASDRRGGGGAVMPWEGDPFWQIRWEDLAPTLVRKLGSGSFGQVYECHFHCAPMAVKIITLDDDTQAVDPQTLLRFKCARAARACCAAARRLRPAPLRPARACARVARPAPAPVLACNAAGRDSPIRPYILTGGPVLRRARRQEVDLQRRLSLHPNIVRFLGACCHLAPGPAPPPRALPGPGQARRPRPGPQQGAKLQPARAAARHRLACNSL